MIYGEVKCPKCKSKKYKKLKGVITNKIIYYECSICKHVWWAFKTYENIDPSNTQEEVTGDNFPLLPDKNRTKKQELRKNKKKYIKELYKWGFKKITKDDIVNFIIDVEMYNKKCKPKKKWN